MVKTAHIGIRVDAKLKAALQRLADADRRSLTGYIEKILADTVEQKRKSK